LEKSRDTQRKKMEPFNYLSASSLAGQEKLFRHPASLFLDEVPPMNLSHTSPFASLAKN
jgi:hypothetical protein